MLVACDIYIILHLATCSAHQTMWQTQSHKPSHQPQNHHFDVFSVFFPNGNFTALGWRWLKPPRLLWPQSHPNPPCFRIKFSRCPRAQEIAAPRPFVCHFPWRLSSWYLPGEDPLEASFTWKRYLEKRLHATSGLILNMISTNRTNISSQDWRRAGFNFQAVNWKVHWTQDKTQ